MSEGCVTIDRIANGYTVSVCDPKIAKANNKPGRWKDPMRKYSFDSLEKVLKFIEKNLDKALPEDDYDSAFETASAAADSKEKY